MWSKLTFVGNCGRDPEMRFTPEGMAVTNLSVAVKQGFGEKRVTMWFRVSLFGKTAEFANQHVKKGARVLIEGTLRPDPVTGGPRVYQKQDGTAGASFEVYGDELRVIDWEGEGNEDGGA